jgi:hypothetical protein
MRISVNDLQQTVDPGRDAQDEATTVGDVVRNQNVNVESVRDAPSYGEAQPASKAKEISRQGRTLMRVS